MVSKVNKSHQVQVVLSESENRRFERVRTKLDPTPSRPELVRSALRQCGYIGRSKGRSNGERGRAAASSAGS